MTARNNPARTAARAMTSSTDLSAPVHLGPWDCCASTMRMTVCLIQYATMVGRVRTELEGMTVFVRLALLGRTVKETSMSVCQTPAVPGVLRTACSSSTLSAVTASLDGLVSVIVVLWFMYIEGFRPEWYIWTIYHCRDIPFW